MSANSLRRVDEADLRDLAFGEIDEIAVPGRPQPVVLETEIFETETGMTGLGDHIGRPGQEVLHTADSHRGIVDVDPIVRKQLPVRPDDERDGKEVAV